MDQLTERLHSDVVETLEAAGHTDPAAVAVGFGLAIETLFGAPHRDPRRLARGVAPLRGPRLRPRLRIWCAAVSRYAPMLLVLAGLVVCAAALLLTPTGIAWAGDGSAADMVAYCDGADIGDVSHHRWVNNHNWRNDACGDVRDRTRAMIALSGVGGAAAGAGTVRALAQRPPRGPRRRWALVWLSPLWIIEAAAAAAVVPIMYLGLLA